MVKNSTKVNINGREIGLLFGLLQVKEFELALVNNLNLYFDSDNMITEPGLAQLIYTANQNSRFLHQGETVSLEEVYEWVVSGRTDETVKNQIIEILTVWNKSERVQLWINEMADLKKKMDAAKKESTKQSKKSKPNTSSTKQPSGRKGTGRMK